MNILNLTNKIRLRQAKIPSDVDVVPQNNAAALSDDNSIGTWSSATRTSVVDGAVDSADVYDGSYSIKVTNTDGGNSRYSALLCPVISGKTYTVSFWAKKPVGQVKVPQVAFRLPFGYGFGTFNISSESWTEYTGVTVATGTDAATEIRFFPSAQTTGDVVTGDHVFVDKITVIETD